MSKDKKAALKAENEGIVAEYGWCMIDGHKEKIGNFKIEPPGLFRGRGDHPKQGKIKVCGNSALRIFIVHSVLYVCYTCRVNKM